MDKDSEKYEIVISYGGNDNYNGWNATKEITIEEEVVEAEVKVHLNLMKNWPS